MASGIEGLTEFEAGLRLEGEQRIPAQVALIRDRLTLGIAGRIDLAMPVDTGFARASGNVSIGTPDERTPAPGLDSYPPPTRGNLPKAEPFEPGYYTNAAPYVVFLNEGSSQQAPAHFIQRAIEEEIADLGG